eukprot:7398478-Lingulodinium_polyedra.AAC.1
MDVSPTLHIRRVMYVLSPSSGPCASSSENQYLRHRLRVRNAFELWNSMRGSRAPAWVCVCAWCALRAFVAAGCACRLSAVRVNSCVVISEACGYNYFLLHWEPRR